LAKWITFGDHVLNVDHVAYVTENPPGGALTVTMVTGAALTPPDVKHAQAREALIAAGIPLATSDRARPMGRVVRTHD
jgi:hypothetical protein